MADVRFTSVMPVELIDTNFSDARVCIAARTSTAGAGADDAERFGLINALMRDRHGTPFEHMNVTVRVTAPIFVWREHHRHRAGFSYNEESGRYKQLDPVFYIPSVGRGIAKVEGTKSMDYVLAMGTGEQRRMVDSATHQVCVLAYEAYERQLEGGIVREVARMILPVSIMSTCIVTMNARSLMAFLSLRQRHDDALFPSKPQWEINQVADQYESILAQYAPMTHRAFVQNRRVAP
ncbi:ThyX-like thymidylate synthase [Mycobacterium phage Myrna]|uniref:ThyX-like thymidylate synthase n=1 Tax=Mycobacterium phage Myrna TaxID=546805 RepID=B5LJ96_9CAUD|nr:gp92 [Mycobacterium phage Myrna]ACH62093.1 ThyX-like thymidylate synthase [Mycobacterium phage Myrna]